MSLDIDMKSLSGADFGSAAESQQVVDTNSYSQETQEFPVMRELLDQPEVDQQPPQQDLNPKSENFRAFREEVDRMKHEREQERRDFQLQIEMLRANMSNPQQSQPQQQRKFLDGMNDNDVPNVAELRKEWQEREAGYAARIEELQVAQDHPDYAEVVEKFVIPLVKQKPHLAQGIRGADNKALFAYELGKMAQAMQASNQAPQQSATAQRIVDNARKPGTLSQAGGQGALSKADYFATMSDQEFMRMANKNLEGI